MSDNQPMVLSSYWRATPLRCRSRPPLLRLVVDLPEVRLLLRLVPNARVVVPGVRPADGHTGVHLTVERFDLVVSLTSCVDRSAMTTRGVRELAGPWARWPLGGFLFVEVGIGGVQTVICASDNLTLSILVFVRGSQWLCLGAFSASHI